MKQVDLPQAAESARLGSPIASVSEGEQKGGSGFTVRLDWPDYVVRQQATNRDWRVNAIDAHLLSVIDGNRTLAQLITVTRMRIKLRTGTPANISDQDVRSAFLRLSMGDILVSRDGLSAVSPKYAEHCVGSLSGSIAVLLARYSDFPMRQS